MTFRTTLLLSGKTATGLVVPEEVVTGLAAGKKPPVKVTLNGYTYRSSIAVMGGDFMIPVSAEIRDKANVKAGDELEVEVELDTEPRVVTVPPDLASALDAEPAARAFFEALSYSNQLRHVLSVDEAKTPETRQRRVEKVVEAMREGRK